MSIFSGYHLLNVQIYVECLFDKQQATQKNDEVIRLDVNPVLDLIEEFRCHLLGIGVLEGVC